MAAELIRFEDLMIMLVVSFVAIVIYRMMGNWVRPKRQRIDDIPRDSMSKVRRDIIRSARVSRPIQLRELKITGDREVHARRIGRIVGLLPHLHYYIVVFRRRGRRRTLLVEREFVSSVLSRVMTVTARGIEGHGELWDFCIPLDNFASVLKFQVLPSEELNELWLQRSSAIQILMEQHATIERIEIRRHAETRAILPKAEIRSLLEGRSMEQQKENNPDV